ncbi:unnamed protein product [Sphenostylis stenocarpa]|uniref:Uncharacterized protein n=1 Tax=Sphenostylis stenocarpa TaxID=92480 RepID=A0AA86TA32_9FABA|nr:unnamed protein product [Sphenostylis stenocarpa]
MDMKMNVEIHAIIGNKTQSAMPLLKLPVATKTKKTLKSLWSKDTKLCSTLAYPPLTIPGLRYPLHRRKK